MPSKVREGRQASSPGLFPLFQMAFDKRSISLEEETTLKTWSSYSTETFSRVKFIQEMIHLICLFVGLVVSLRAEPGSTFTRDRKRNWWTNEFHLFDI